MLEVLKEAYSDIDMVSNDQKMKAMRCQPTEEKEDDVRGDVARFAYLESTANEKERIDAEI